MSDDIFQQADFLSAKPPAKNISDFSGLLSQKELSTLESVSQSVHFHPKVIILPQEFAPSPSALQFARELAHAWRLPSKGFLVVVDLKDHQVRGLAGVGLREKGITDTFLTDEVFAKHFVPHMKQNDLYTALVDTLASVDVQAKSNELVHGTRIRGSQEQYYGRPSNLAQLTSSTFLVLLAVLIILAAGGYYLNQRKRGLAAKKSYEKLTPRLNELYKKADEIAQASEYLNIETNAGLAERVAVFFNRVSALSAAQKDLDHIYKGGSAAGARDGVMKVAQMVSMLEAESKQLLPEVSSVTGVVGGAASLNSPESIAREFEQEAQERVNKLKLQSQNEQEEFRRPSWAYQPAYYQPVDSGAGLMSLALMMNQMQMNQRLDDVLYETHRRPLEENAGGGIFADGGASWGTTDAGGWGGGDSGNDFGGGGDFGSDGGGDWGGDAGGGDW